MLLFLQLKVFHYFSNKYLFYYYKQLFYKQKTYESSCNILNTYDRAAVELTKRNTSQ